MSDVNDNLMRETITRYSRAARLLDPMRLQVWEEMDINFPQLRILFRVRAHPGIDLRTLAEQMGISASAASQQVDKLVDRKLLERKDDPEDRRRLSLELTERGRQATGEISRASRSYLESALSTLSREELSDLHRILGHILEHAPSPASTQRH
jgi:DNA-binding MarR family transcriptional regulator